MLASLPALAVEIPRLPDASGSLPGWSGGFEIERMAADAPHLPEGSAASARLGWDGVGLRVSVLVRDATPSESFYPAGAYQRDSVELFLAPDPTAGACLQAVISPGLDPDHPKPRLYLFDNRPEALKAVEAACEYRVERNPQGYRVEARIPWTVIGILPSDGVEVGTRIFVNDHDGLSVRTRFSWAPSVRPFHAVRLAERPSAAVRSAAWMAYDLGVLESRLNVVGPADWIAKSAAVRDAGGGRVSGEFIASAAGSGTSVVVPEGARAPFEIGLPDGSRLEVAKGSEAQRKALFQEANSPRQPDAARATELAFARLAPARFVFGGGRFPRVAFPDPEKVRRLLGGDPELAMTWFDREGRMVDIPAGSGLYGCLVEIATPTGEKLRRTFTLFRLPDGASTIERDDEHAAQVLGFELSGADATRTHAARVASGWWHRTLTTCGRQIRYPFGIRLPKTPAPTEGARLPLLVFLHGTGGGGAGADAEFFAKFDGALDTFGGAVVYPRSDSFWQPGAVQDVIDAVCREHPIDPDRIYLSGFSMGGIGAWEVLLDRPERFAAAAIIGGRSGSPADAWRLKRVPVRVLNGADDPTTTVEEAMLMVDAIRRAGGRVETEWIAGADHGPSMARSLADPGFYRWLERWTR